MGKVTLVNTLIVSQFIFLLSSLPSPSSAFFDKYEKKIFKFLWRDGPERIKRKTMYNDYDQGGLKLQNLRAVDLKLKAALVPKLHKNENWFCSKLLSFSSPVLRTSTFPFAQLKTNDFEILIKKVVSLFFRQVIQSWLKYQLRPPENSIQVKQQLLCLNSHICISRRPFCSSAFFNKKVLFVNDIIDAENNFLSFDNFVVKFGDVCTAYQYHQLLSAIPSQWKHLLRQGSSELRVCIPACRDVTWLHSKNINKCLYAFYMNEARLC